MYRALKAVVPRSVKDKVVDTIRNIAASGGDGPDAKRYRQEIDLLHYRLDEMATQIATLSAQIRAQSSESAAEDIGAAPPISERLLESGADTSEIV